MVQSVVVVFVDLKINVQVYSCGVEDSTHFAHRRTVFTGFNRGQQFFADTGRSGYLGALRFRKVPSRSYEKSRPPTTVAAGGSSAEQMRRRRWNTVPFGLMRRHRRPVSELRPEPTLPGKSTGHAVHLISVHPQIGGIRGGSGAASQLEAHNVDQPAEGVHHRVVFTGGDPPHQINITARSFGHLLGADIQHLQRGAQHHSRKRQPGFGLDAGIVSHRS